MIRFKNIIYQNFLSAGNSPITINIEDHPLTLVLGTSGDGKSTMIDVLCFGLYGKPYRGVNKPSLVNSVNAKHCKVSIEFETKGKNFRVVRGIAPGIFEIWANGIMMNQDSATRDYQQILENQILGMNFKTFTQISIIGSATYTPFMKMKTADRRAVIEDVLDISVFSVMNGLNKIRLTENKEKLNHLESIYTIKKAKVDSCQRIISLLSDKHNNELEEIRQHIFHMTDEKHLIKTNIVNIDKEIYELRLSISKASETRQGMAAIKEKISSCRTNYKHIKNDLHFFNDKDTCPTCSRGMESSFKDRMKYILSEKESAIVFMINDLETIKNKIQNKIEQYEQIEKTIAEQTNVKLSLETNVAILTKNIKAETKKLEEKTELTGDITKTRTELKDVARDILSMIEERRSLIEERGIAETAAELLKDTGIKTTIIMEYLPLINKMINQILSSLELFVDFHLDENFNETIRSRYRDKFSYHNFSEGERLRIDLAIMLAWRQIARLKNSAATNILLTDEILVGRLGEEDTKILINLLRQISREGTMIMAIAHGASDLAEKFGRVLTFSKVGNFSVMTEEF